MAFHLKKSEHFDWKCSLDLFLLPYRLKTNIKLGSLEIRAINSPSFRSANIVDK
jgi:hypothetical protein